eukprot:scaffold231804_cov18-Prasinocladus_malaysianus.AAC.2
MMKKGETKGNEKKSLDRKGWLLCLRDSGALMFCVVTLAFGLSTSYNVIVPAERCAWKIFWWLKA